MYLLRLAWANQLQVVGRRDNLIKMGAKVVTFSEIKGDNPTEEKILASMNGEPVHFDELVRGTRLTFGEVGACLTVMVISGKVIDLGGSYYGKRH